MAEVVGCIGEGQTLAARSITCSEDAEQQISDLRAVVESSAGQIGEIASALETQSITVQSIADGAHEIAENAQASARFAEKVIASVSSSEKTINEQFTDLEARGIRNYVLHRAKSDHLLWKKRLSEMLVGINSLKVTELSDHTQCRLGKWYEAVKDPIIKRHPAFQALLPVHELVHRYGREAAVQHAEGNRPGAVEAIRKMESASADVLKYLEQLINTASKAPGNT